ncbi:MAG: hypothetical protein ABIQ73_25975 [Acidimicrobiales bacterium]
MTSRRHDVDPLIELLGDRTRLNLPAEAPGPPSATRRNRRRSVEFTELPELPHEEVFLCPSCATPGQLDIREGASGRCYLSCPSCFKMWQEVREPDRVFQMADDTLWQMK